MNNARGKLLEQLIENSCRLYEEEGKALIEKTPEPMRVVRKLNDGAHFICRIVPSFPARFPTG